MKKNILNSFIILLIVVLFFLVLNIMNSLKKTQIKEVEIIEKIQNYPYVLNENDSPYFSSEFKKLKKILEEKEAEEEYAKQISKLFVIDFYSLNYAVNKNDIGGTQFVYEEYKDDFEKSAKDTIYNKVENNIYGNRNQELPVIKKVEIKDFKKVKFEADEVKDNNAYSVTMKVEYEKDLDYPTDISLILVHKNNLLQISKIE